MIIIIWIAFVVLCAWGGHRIFSGKGRNGTLGAVIAGVIAFILSPLVGAVALLIMHFAVPTDNVKKYGQFGQGGGYNQFGQQGGGYNQYQGGVQPAQFNQQSQYNQQPPMQQGGYRPYGSSNPPPVKPAQASATASTSTASSGGSSERVARMKELELLKSEGLISDDEYSNMRQDILKS